MSAVSNFDRRSSIIPSFPTRFPDLMIICFSYICCGFPDSTKKPAKSKHDVPTIFGDFWRYCPVPTNLNVIKMTLERGAEFRGKDGKTRKITISQSSIPLIADVATKDEIQERITQKKDLQRPTQFKIPKGLLRELQSFQVVWLSSNSVLL